MARVPGSKRAEIDARRRKALEMALAGASYEQIARECGWKNRSSACRAVEAAMQEWAPISAEDVRTLRDRELARLDRLQNAHWMNALRGDSRATELCLRISDRRARLLGLDAPVKVDAVVKSGLDAEIDELLALMPDPTKG